MIILHRPHIPHQVLAMQKIEDLIKVQRSVHVKKKKKNHPDIGYVTQETCGIREAKPKSQEINAGNCEREPHTRTLNATVNRVDISFMI